MSTPAIENLITYYGEPDITLLGSSISIEILKNYPNIDKFQVLDKKNFIFV